MSSSAPDINQKEIRILLTKANASSGKKSWPVLLVSDKTLEDTLVIQALSSSSEKYPPNLR